MQPAEENQQEEPNEGIPAEAPEGSTVPEERINKGKRKVAEEEVEDFVSEEAYSNWRKHYAGKGFVAERRFKNPITPFKEMIEKKRLGNPLRTSKSRICSSSEGVLLELGREEGQYCIRQGSVGAIWSTGH